MYFAVCEQLSVHRIYTKRLNQNCSNQRKENFETTIILLFTVNEHVEVIIHSTRNHNTQKNKMLTIKNISLRTTNFLFISLSYFKTVHK